MHSTLNLRAAGTFCAPKPIRVARIGFTRAVLVVALFAGFAGSSAAQNACPAGSVTQDFAFTSAQQTYTVPAGVRRIGVQALGAQGANGAGAQGGTGGLGSSASGLLATTPGDTLYVFVGGQGNAFNGGGLGGGATIAGVTVFPGGTGGGASDVRVGAATPGARAIVAGGGGGGGGQALNTLGTSTTLAGGAGGAGGTGSALNGANGVSGSTRSSTVGSVISFAGEAGFGGQSGVGGAPGNSCPLALGTAGNGSTGAGGNTLDLSSSITYRGGAGGGGGGGAVQGGGGGGGSAGTIDCSWNDVGAGGGGAGGTSAAFAGISNFVSTTGVRSGDGTVRLCVPNTAQNLTFNLQPDQTFSPGGTFNVNPLATSATPNSGNPITYSSLTPGVCTVSGTQVSIVTAGVCTIAANQVGDAAYLDAFQQTRSLTIAQATQTLTFGAQANQVFVASGTFNINPLATSATPNSGNAITYSSLTTGICTVAGTVVTMVAPGTCTVAADQAGNANYLAANRVTQDIVVGQVPQTLSFGAQANQPFVAGGTFSVNPLATSASPNSGNPIVYSSLSTSVCTVSGTTVTIVSAGTCTLAADQAGNAAYAPATQISRSLIILQASQTLTFGAQPGQTFSAGGTFAINPLATSASPNSGNAITYSSLTTLVCTVSGTTVTMVAAGTCTIAANQAGNTNFTPAAQVTQNIAIGQAAQSLTFPPASSPSNRPFVPGSTFAIDPVATNAGPNSGNPIVYSSLSPSVCSVLGTTVTMLSPGTCVIAANQAGDTNFAAAAQVTRVYAFDAPAVPVNAAWMLWLAGLLLALLGVAQRKRVQ